jgi:hypothetical protein
MDSSTMRDGWDELLGDWAASGEMDLGDRKLTITGRATLERIGPFVVLRSTVQPPEFPDSISIIEGGDPGAPAPMHYFDERGVQRLYVTTLADDRWTIWSGDERWRESPGFRQRYVGALSPARDRITGAWERGLGDAGDRWETDFRLDYERIR